LDLIVIIVFIIIIIFLDCYEEGSSSIGVEWIDRHFALRILQCQR
jgi:hypothetical protein